MTFRSALRCVTLLAALLLPEIARAQRADTARSATPDSIAQRIEPVIVTGARAPAATGGASAVVAPIDALSTPPAPSLEQALREMPFVLVRQNSRGETELSVRGSDSRQAAVLMDGIPLSLGWDHRTDPSLVPLTGARRLTVVRGLSTVLAGPNVLGGQIEVDVAGGPTEVGPSGMVRPQLSLSTGFDHNAARVLTASAAAPIDFGSATLIARGGGAYRERDGLLLGRGARVGGSGDAEPGEGTDPGQADDPDLRTNSDLQQLDGFASLRLEGAGGAYAGLTATTYRAERGVPPELHIDEPRLWRYPDIRRALGVLTAGSGRRSTPWGRGSLEMSAGINDGSLEIAAFTDPTYETVDEREYGDERSITGRLLATHSLPGGAELRVSVTHADIRYDERFDDEPASRYRQRLSSAGAEIQTLLFSRAVVTGGVVYDRATTPETGGRPSLDALSRVGWRFGATTFAGEGSLRLHASLSDRARFPALRELYSGSLARFEPNPELQPERLIGAEVGATLLGGAAADAGLSLQSVVFHHRLRDAVVRITTPEGLFRRVNRDEIRSTGVELMASWSPVHALRGLSVSADLLAQRVRVRDLTATPGEPVVRHAEHQPQLRGSLDVGVPLPLDVRALGSIHYTGRQYCMHPDLGREVALGAQTGGDVSLSRSWSVGGASALWSRLRTVLALDNLADATFYDQCGLPRPGRTLRVALELR